MPGAMAEADEIAWSDQRRSLEQATADPTLRRQAHRLLWDFCQFLRDPEAAMWHLRQAIAEDPLFSRPHLAPSPPVRSVLILAAPGDYQSNLPLERLFDETTLLHTLWIADAGAMLRDPRAAIPAELPRVDCVFIAIAEDERHGTVLRAADALAEAIGRPVLNHGGRIAACSRAGTSRLLGEMPDAVVPSHHLLGHGDTPPIDFPVIIRPLGSHAGDRLRRVDHRDDLLDYYASHATAPRFTVAPFIDYRSPDGFWRKYRIIFVDGVAYPLHLAIHDDWAVWYYNAHMQACPDKQREERRFLADIASVMPERCLAALRHVAQCVGLDYFGLDCGVMPDGRLVVFEIETGMIVQNGSGEAAARIRKAVEHLVDAKPGAPPQAPPQTPPKARLWNPLLQGMDSQGLALSGCRAGRCG